MKADLVDTGSVGKYSSNELLDTMKVNDTSSNPTAAAGTSQATGPSRVGHASSANTTAKTNAGDDIHLSELVRSLRSLAADSPQRQEHLEKIARSYAQGTYTVNPAATASKIIDDATKR